MKKSKIYELVRFSAEALSTAASTLWPDVPVDERTGTLLVAIDGARWSYDDEAEFYADYRRSSETAYFWRHAGNCMLEVTAEVASTQVDVRALDRATIERVFAVFESAAPHAQIAPPAEPKPTIFIGHGGAADWRDLKDHLHEQHDYPVEAYETGSRAGHAVRDVLEDMLDSSSFAILVMTGEDETADGSLRARQNVVHEAGLFQGALGFNRAIVLLENGVESFSNIEGINQIRFDRGHIRSTFGDVLATLRREFGRPA